MHFLLAASLATTLVAQGSTLSAERGSEDTQRFLDQDWGFEWNRSDGRLVVRAVSARHVEKAGRKEFLGSLRTLERLDVASSTLAPGDIRALAGSCPFLRSIRITNRGSASLEAAVWPEFFEFRGLKDLSVTNLRCSGNEKWAIHDIRNLDSLAVSGNLSGMLPALLAPCKTRCLQIELLDSRQELTAADYAALGSHAEIESLEILGDVSGGGMFVDLNALSGLKRVRQLTLRLCSIDPQSLHCLPALRKLSLQTCRFTEHEFDSVLSHPGLEELVLRACKSKDLRIACPLAGPPKNLRQITLQFPPLADVTAFYGLPCSYHVQLGLAGMCTPTSEAYSLQSLGQDEVALLERLKELRSVSFTGFSLPYRKTEVSAAALVRLSRIDTLRSLEVRYVDSVQDLPPGTSKEARDLEEVRFLTDRPLSRDVVARFLGAHTRLVVLGDYSDDAKAYSQRSDAARYSPKEVCLFGVDLPVSQESLEWQLLTDSVEKLDLEDCYVKKGAIKQLLAKCPSLKHITLGSVEDEQELLRLNDLDDLKSVDFNCGVSASTAQAIKAVSVRLGIWDTP